jgi:hypothetical protein
MRVPSTTFAVVLLLAAITSPLVSQQSQQYTIIPFSSRENALAVFESSQGDRWYPRIFDVTDDGEFVVPDPEHDRIATFNSDGRLIGSFPSPALGRGLIYFAIYEENYLAATLRQVIVFDADGELVWQMPITPGIIPRAIYTLPDYVEILIPVADGETTLVVDGASGQQLGYLEDSSSGRSIPMVLTPDGATLPAYMAGASEDALRGPILSRAFADGTRIYSDQLDRGIVVTVVRGESVREIEMRDIPLQESWRTYRSDSLYWSQATPEGLRIGRRELAEP